MEQPSITVKSAKLLDLTKSIDCTSKNFHGLKGLKVSLDATTGNVFIQRIIVCLTMHVVT